jgi:plasmid rolling circle replication initiator protein Rep
MPEISPSDTALDSTTLAQLSPRDKPWNKHRSNADKVAAYYAGSEFENYANRVNLCSELLDFRFQAAADGLLDLKLDAVRFCRVRSCPVCQWRRSLMWKSKAHKILPQIAADYPTHRWLFLTLTLRNCPVTELRSTLTQMHDSFSRMVKLKSFPAVGWLKSTEVTRGKDGSAHPHFHCLLMVSAGYFGGRAYIKQTEWVQIWKRSLRIDYDPVVEIRAVKKGDNPAVLIPELLKYCTKESDLVADKEWFLELTRQMHNSRVVSTGGLLKKYLKELEKEPEDLIGSDDEENKIESDAHILFEWKRRDKEYKLVD